MGNQDGWREPREGVAAGRANGGNHRKQAKIGCPLSVLIPLVALALPALLLLR